MYMQEGIIQDLYVNFVGTSEYPRRYHLLNGRIDEVTRELNNKMNPKLKKKLKRLCDDYEEVYSIGTEEAFISGFSFAIHLMTEAYAHK